MKALEARIRSRCQTNLKRVYNSIEYHLCSPAYETQHIIFRDSLNRDEIAELFLEGYKIDVVEEKWYKISWESRI